MYSVSRPPRIRPTAPPPPWTAPYTPNALARSSGSVKVTATSDSAAGASSAAKAPCRARAPNSVAAFSAKPPRAEAAAKPTSPATNARLRPAKSATRPPSRSSPPNASAYAVMARCRFASEIRSSACACSRAMLTMEASSTTIRVASVMTANASHRRGSAGVRAYVVTAPPGPGCSSQTRG